MPKPLPFAMMNVQRFLRRASSPPLSVAGMNGVSVTAGGAPACAAWTLVPQATIPLTIVPSPAAEFVQLPATGRVASSFTTIEVGTAGVRVLLIRSCCAESERRPLGVTGHEQQEIICSSGENAYTFAQMEPVIVALVPD